MAKQPLLTYMLLAAALLFTGCSKRILPGLSYDPPGSTDTRDKPIRLQERKVFAFEEEGIYFSNRMEGGRLNGVTQTGTGRFTLNILPENSPINNSAWYAFQVWADSPVNLTLSLTYQGGRHRYHPKISLDGNMWKPVDNAFYQPDTLNQSATFTVQAGPDTLWVAAQENITSSQFGHWFKGMEERPAVQWDTLGYSRQGRPLHLLMIGNRVPEQGYVLVISRQHPPEVTGTIAALEFLETLAGDSPEAIRFRTRFTVLAVPLMNPDGVDEGHWRHNLGGVDLNRDWATFNQVETRTVSQFFLQLKENQQRPVYFGIDFHSTSRDVFYTLDRSLPTRPTGLTDRWLEGIQKRLPGYNLVDEPGGLGSPVSKNWFYLSFQAPSVTYEVGDRSDRNLIREVASISAYSLMEQLNQLN